MTNATDNHKLDNSKALTLLTELLTELERAAPQAGPIVELRYALGLRSAYNSPEVYAKALVASLGALQTAPVAEPPTVTKPKASETQLELIYALAQLMAGLQVPASIGEPLGEARPAWVKLRDMLHVQGWSNSIEHASALLYELGFSEQ